MELHILKTKDLVFSQLIHYPNLNIQQGHTTFIVGPSGSGKSTLLRLFNGVLSPSSGEIHYQNDNILSINTIDLRKEILLIGQNVFLFDQSIRGNFGAFYDYREEPTPTEDTMKFFLSLCMANFTLDQDCTSMSGGERQRIYIAIFLSFLPKVLMLDEPTAALDALNSQQLLYNILTFCKEKKITTIIVSHDHQLTQQFADDIIELKDGRN